MKDLYLISNFEPCFMCAMALTHSRISRIYMMSPAVTSNSSSLGP